MQGQLDIPARILLEEVFYKVEDQPLWNPLTTECRIIKVIPFKYHEAIFRAISS